MTFTPKVWKSKPDPSTPLSSTALIDLETRLAAYTDSAVAAGGGGGTVDDATVGALPSVAGKQVKLNYRGIVAASTAYAIGDIVVYRGKRILITTAVTSGSGATPFISGGNYMSLTPDSVFHAGDWGVVGDGTTDNATALQNCINAANALGGGTIQLPIGIIVVGSTIDVLSNVLLIGQGLFAATQIRLANGANCDVIKVHRSTGAGNSNGFYTGLWNMSVDGNRNNQSPGSFFNCVTVITNPYNTTQSGDPDFDPKHIFFNVWFRQATGHGFYYSGRSDLRVIGCFAQYNNGHGFYSSFDSHYDACVAGFNGLSGFCFFFSALQATNCKSYNNGVNRRWQTGLNYTLGQPVYYSATGSPYDGSVYAAKAAVTGAVTAPPSDTANWALAAAPNTLANSVANDLPWGFGYYAGNPTGVGELTIAGCAAEQNSGTSFYLRGKGCAIQGVSANPNWDNQTGGTGTNKTTNPDEFAHVVLDGASGSIIDVGCGAGNGSGSAAVRYGLGLLTGSTKNTIVMGDDGTANNALTPSSITAVGSTNSYRWNGVSVTDVLGSVPDVVITSATDGQALIFDSATSKWKNGAPGAGSAFAAGLFGDGSGGAIVLDGTTGYPLMSRSGSVYTMTGDIFPTNLTVNAGVTLKTAGYKVFATGTVTVAATGIISNDGNDGTALGVAGAATPNGTTVPGAAGGAGNTGAGTAGSNNSTVAANVGVGTSGAGGLGSGGAGGGQAFSGSSTSTLLRSALTVANGVMIFNGGIRGVSGAPSGGGGGGDATNKGGGGGGGGGALLIFARTIVNHGTLSAKGGAGGSPATGNAGGGGGGGGGVIATYSLSAWTNDGTTVVTGGTGGTPVGTGVAGGAGSAGTATNFVVS